MDTHGSTAAPTRSRPFTGKEFLESLRDGREIWIYGERVEDVTTHPAFRNPARMLARLYDALHEPATQAVLTCATDTGSGGYTHRYFRAPASADDLVAARDAIAAWARLTYGWMGRSPDYKAAFLATLGANADFYAPYQDNARRWYRAAQERVIAEMNTPGVKLICRPSYAMTAEVMGSPFDYPLSSRMDENDAIVVLDRALIPWENVLIYEDVKKSNTFFQNSGFFPRAML